MAEITFNRPKKYALIRELGNGACGKTVLLRDLDLDIEVVAKKYAPIPELDGNPVIRNDFLMRFRKEAKILIQATHENIVRVFTYYDYPEEYSAYFLMEYVNGDNIIEYVKNNSHSCESLFLETLSGFCYLANKGIIHRDVRPQNILVTSSGNVKIIDFGFAKESTVGSEQLSAAMVKSVTLNWWASRPTDFQTGIYDETTEVYFVGKLLEEVVRSSGVENFRYREVIEKMTVLERGQRLQNFADVSQLASRINLGVLAFSPNGVTVYREFSKALSEVVAKIGMNANFNKDYSSILTSLEALYKSVLLEEDIPDVVKVSRIFIDGEYTFFRHYQFPVELLANFIALMKSLDEERKAIVFSNLYSRLDALPRYSVSTMDDDIPF